VRCRQASRALSDYQRARRDRRISRAAQRGRRGRDGFALEVRGFALFRTSPSTNPSSSSRRMPAIRTRPSFVPGMWKAGARSSRRGCRHAVPLLPTLRLQLPAFCPSPDGFDTCPDCFDLLADTGCKPSARHDRDGPPVRAWARGERSEPLRRYRFREIWSSGEAVNAFRRAAEQHRLLGCRVFSRKPFESVPQNWITRAGIVWREVALEH
jgi:hypothetical protein